jgi:hypothetical protein
MEEEFAASFPFIFSVHFFILVFGPAQKKAKRAGNTACAGRRARVWHL